MLVVLPGSIFLHSSGSIAAEESQSEVTAASSGEQFAIHGQATYVEQESSSLRAPYRGPNSLAPNEDRETTDATLYLGARIWPGAELWITPEVDQGFGLSNTLGLAGFSSGEAYKVGRNRPYFRLPRAFVRHTINLDGTLEALDTDQLRLAGSRSVNRWVFTVGKFSVTDVFDTNQYAHDPRNDFLNWAAVDAGSFDYAADSWGFTVGAAAEWYEGNWTLRTGVFDLSNVPNSPHLDPGLHEFQIDSEIEHRHKLREQPGRILVTVFDSRGRMGLLDRAIQVAAAPDIAAVRQYRSRLGASLDIEQHVSADIGVFARVGKAAGNVEAYEFTDIDRSTSAGASIKGSAWYRHADTVGIAVIVNGISAARERYFNAGGLGILVGDGKLPHPRAERIIETYYKFAVISHADLSFDYQWAKDPAYNADRGPVSIVAVRLHAQF